MSNPLFLPPKFHRFFLLSCYHLPHPKGPPASLVLQKITTKRMGHKFHLMMRKKLERKSQKRKWDCWASWPSQNLQSNHFANKLRQPAMKLRNNSSQGNDESECIIWAFYEKLVAHRKMDKSLGADCLGHKSTQGNWRGQCHCFWWNIEEEVEWHFNWLIDE